MDFLITDYTILKNKMSRFNLFRPSEMRFNDYVDNPHIKFSLEDVGVTNLLLRYFDDNHKLNFTMRFVKRQEDLDVRLNFFSEDSRWKNEYIVSVVDFIDYVSSSCKTDIYYIFDKDVMDKLVHSYMYNKEDVLECYNKVGEILRPVVMHLSRNREFVNTKTGKVMVNNNKLE